MPPIEPIVRKLDRAQAGLLRAADAIRADQWTSCPGDGAWCAGEIVGHLIMVERTILGKADRITQKPVRLTPVWKRFHLPLALVEARLIRLKTPIPLDPQLIREKEEMLGELQDVRGRTLAFLEETKNRELGWYYWSHPFLGTLNLYEWFQMIACHELRHSKQMQEIAATLPKAVGALRK